MKGFRMNIFSSLFGPDRRPVEKNLSRLYGIVFGISKFKESYWKAISYPLPVFARFISLIPK